MQYLKKLNVAVNKRLRINVRELIIMHIEALDGANFLIGTIAGSIVNYIFVFYVN